ncbi:glutamate--cysteine ligase [Sphaerisporangium sp. NPDC051017]|uniref:carboxylate-amine ligase n=1 Tax=Sphaerisporangium sp. NPDC051017 TaxID=3154636 RepID=UPI0034146AF4
MDEESEDPPVQCFPAASMGPAPPVRAEPGESARPTGRDGWTLGVEEEFLLAEPGDGCPVLANARVMGNLAGPDDPRAPGADFKIELLASMMESVSPVCTTLAELRALLTSARARLARAAARAGVRVVATGTPVGRPRAPRDVSDKKRYREMRDLYGLLVTQQETCGCHVHVGVADREVAVEVVNRLRPWLPTLLALSANSPFCEGADTGYASWRTVALSRWPATDIPPRFSSAAHYDQVTGMLHRSGALVGTAHPYWLARPSARFPTVEVRAADVAATVDEAVLQAALSRALVRTACAEIAAGGDAPPAEDEDQILRAALWSAARYGLNGPGVHPRTGEQVPARAILDEMLARVRPALCELGDEPEVDRLLAGLDRTGTGAERQRALIGTGDVAAGAARVADAFALESGAV